jgi:hypothetical protein
MRDIGSQQGPASAADQAAAEQPGPGKQTLTEKASQTSTQRAGDRAGPDSKANAGPGKQSLVECIERAEQQLARPGYQYLAPFARPMITEARKPGADSSLAAQLDHLFEVSKSDGAGDLHAAKVASNAYHARLGDQAITELSAKAPSGSPAARDELEPVARSLEAKYEPLLEDDVHLQIHLGQIAAKHGGRAPAISIEVSIRPNDFSCFGWLSWDTLTGMWRMIRGGAEPTEAPPPPNERSPLLDGQQRQHAQQPQPTPPMGASGGSTSHDAPPPKNTNVGSGEASIDGAPPAPVAQAAAPVPEEATTFVHRLKATGTPTANLVDRVKTTPPAAKNPQEESGKKQPGYVINMATIPGEVQPTMASRYFEGERAKAADRTAVVVGVNSFLGMDASKDGEKTAAVTKGIGDVTEPANGQMAVFGYTWNPGWTMDGQPIQLGQVREEWRKLPSPAQAPAARLMDGVVKDTLPYGFFRNQVLNSVHTRNAVMSIGQHADPVHIVVQDADGGVDSASGKHVLTAYDEVLQEMERHPLLTIGGYHFKGHTWPADSSERTKQLTELSNEVDRAIRAAIATVYPEMLYPTEPNMLIKAQDKQHNDGVFDRNLQDVPGGLFGLGASEGRTARQNILRADNADGVDDKHDHPVHYAPSTSTMTSPVPERPERGLTVPATPEHMQHAISGELYKERTGAKDVKPDKQYPSLVVEEQSQNPLAPRRLNQEFVAAYENTNGKIPNAAKKKVKDGFEQPADQAKKKTTPVVNAPVEPSNEASSSSSAQPPSKARKGGKVKAEQAPHDSVVLAQRIAAAITTAMSDDKMRKTWEDLSQILTDLKKEAEAKKQDKTEDGHGS